MLQQTGSKHKDTIGTNMKITKRQLRRIIKEEKAKLVELHRGPRQDNPEIEEGLWRGAYQLVWDRLEAEAAAGPLDITEVVVAESWADALETIANELRDGAAGRNPGGSIG